MISIWVNITDGINMYFFFISFKNIRLYVTIIVIPFVGFIIYIDVVYMIIGEKKEMKLCFSQVPVFYQN